MKILNHIVPEYLFVYNMYSHLHGIYVYYKFFCTGSAYGSVLCIEPHCTQEPLGASAHSNLCQVAHFVAQHDYFAHSAQPLHVVTGPYSVWWEIRFVVLW